MANHDVFEKELELDGEIKKMIRALVNHHENSNPIQAKNPDLIEGKGRSLVMLFHGKFVMLEPSETNVLKVLRVLARLFVLPITMSLLFLTHQFSSRRRLSLKKLAGLYTLLVSLISVSPRPTQKRICIGYSSWPVAGKQSF